MLPLLAAAALLTTSASPAAAAPANLGQCTFYAFAGCSGSTSTQNLPLNYFPAYSSFRCTTKTQACYDQGCSKCTTVDAGGCEEKTTNDLDGKVVNYVCFLPLIG
ncbi:unnamed protein product [Parajaminaea phylloscopi]